jgi:hypothetical protein
VSGLEITLGLLEGLEPDALVVSKEEDAEAVGWGRRRLTMESLSQEGEQGRRHCTDVLPLYRHLYETRFRFEQRQSVDAIVAGCSSDTVGPIVAATVGRQQE